MKKKVSGNAIRKKAYKKKRWTKKKEKDWNKIIWFITDLSYLIILLLSIYVAFQGTMIFVLQWHNIDLDYNLGLIVNDVNKINYKKADCNFTMIDYRSLQDQYLPDKSYTVEDWYIMSSVKLREMWLTILPIVFIIGFCFSYLLTRLMVKFK